MIFDLSLFIDSLPILLYAALTTLQIALCAAVIGGVFGTLIGVIQTKGSRLMRLITEIYVTFFRGTPMLIQIFFLFYLLPEVGLFIPPVWAAIFAIGLNSAAYISQVIRSGINAIPTGQLEAAQTLGMSSYQTTRYILLPQTIRMILPALGNELITLIKDSSLASVIGVVELSKQGSIIRSTTYDAFTVLLAVSLIYLTITSSVSFCIKYIEKRAPYHA